MDLLFEILIFLALFASIAFNFLLYKDFVILKFNEQAEKQLKPEQIIEKKDKKDKETPEDKMISGLNNLLTYDGSPNKKE